MRDAKGHDPNGFTNRYGLQLGQAVQPDVPQLHQLAPRTVAAEEISKSRHGPYVHVFSSQCLTPQEHQPAVVADVGMGQKHGQPVERDVLGELECLELRWKVGGRLEDGPDAFTVRVGVCRSQAHNFPVRRRPQKQVAAARPVASDVGRTPVLKGSQHLQHRPIGSVCLAFSSSVKTSR